MKDIFRVRRMWRPRAELKDRYDVVIVGGGSHGLATAYYLAKNHGITNVAVLEKLSEDYLATDVSATLAGLSVRGEAVMRRITDLDLDALPAAGAVSHVQAIVTRDGDSFALWFGQEYSDYLAEVVIDAWEGLQR